MNDKGGLTPENWEVLLGILDTLQEHASATRSLVHDTSMMVRQIASVVYADRGHVTTLNELINETKKVYELLRDIEVNTRRYPARWAPDVPTETETVNGLSDDTPIDELELSTRVINCFKNMGLSTVRDVRKHTRQQLLCQPNFGHRSIREVEEIIGNLKER